MNAPGTTWAMEKFRLPLTVLIYWARPKAKKKKRKQKEIIYNKKKGKR